MHKIKCIKCGGIHKLRNDKFPNKAITHDKHKRVNIVGYVCLKCSRKGLVEKRDKGVGWRQALKEFFKPKEELKYVG